MLLGRARARGGARARWAVASARRARRRRPRRQRTDIQRAPVSSGLRPHGAPAPRAWRRVAGRGYWDGGRRELAPVGACASAARPGQLAKVVHVHGPVTAWPDNGASQNFYPRPPDGKKERGDDGRDADGHTDTAGRWILVLLPRRPSALTQSAGQKTGTQVYERP